MTAEIILIVAAALLAWTYLVYPASVILVSRLKRRAKPDNHPVHNRRPLPSVTVIMSLHNEKQVTAEKIASMLDSDYPDGMLDFLVGSDGSTDGTNALLSAMAATDHSLRCMIHAERRGKAAMLNDLVSQATGEILIVTDANVMFTRTTVRRLAEAMANPSVGLCDATLLPIAPVNTGIVRQENLYSRFETALKRAEGDLWGTMPGPYGGCYAVRRELFPVLPENTLVDDLFVGLTVLKQDFRSVNAREAVVHEDTQPDMTAQYRRRVRIAAGSFQNLFRFGLCPGNSFAACFAYLSHKIMRWLTPLLLLLFFMTSVILSGWSDFYLWLTAFQLIFIILSALDIVLAKRTKRIRIQRFVTQFLLMNAALAAGFVKALRGIENGIWEPTKRV
jgi:cellulose synthase/poly-beta-1,6-N-acetylglucosamine synthase-like glycosyltransferase